MGEPYIHVKLERPSLADNMDRQNVIMQLSSAGEISRKKAYSWLGITDAVDERKERLEEDAEIQKVQMVLWQSSDVSIHDRYETYLLVSKQDLLHLQDYQSLHNKEAFYLTEDKMFQCIKNTVLSFRDILLVTFRNRDLMKMSVCP